MDKLVEEGKAVINVPIVKAVSREMDVFYNPIMKFNRDISILLLNSIDKNRLNIADPLAGSGVRSIRFLLELKKNKIETISINDYSLNAFKSIKNNFKLNKIKNNKNTIVKNEDANLFLLNSAGFDYIDVDPFGTPNPYLDSAVKRISREGVLAVTATDTSALAGTYPKACLRKYWAAPLRNELMHETGLRILIRKVQLIGAQYNKALVPVFSYFKDHYMRVFLRCKKGKEEADNILKLHGYFEGSGPIWKGLLWDKKLVNKIYKSINKKPLKIKSIINKPLIKFLKTQRNLQSKFLVCKKLLEFLSIIKEESKINTIGFYDLHKVAKRYKVKIPRKEELIKRLRRLGYKASETHFSGVGIRSDVGLNKLVKMLK